MTVRPHLIPAGWAGCSRMNGCRVVQPLRTKPETPDAGHAPGRLDAGRRPSLVPVSPDRQEPVIDLSILDILPVPSGTPPTETLARSRELARLGDELGYRRIWYAEHHGTAGIAATSPDLMIAHVAPATERIRVGAGGVMMPNHMPLQVVERYRALEALHPGRVDLGIGRAPGTDPLTARALRSVSGEHVGGLIRELVAFGREDFPDDHPFRRVGVTPSGVRLPPLWMLGSSGGSARLAGEIGAGYAFASHFSPTPAGPAVAMYRETFEPSDDFPEPRVILALSVVCAETTDEAYELSLSVQLQFSRIRKGTAGPVPSPEEARAEGWTPRGNPRGPVGGLVVVGDPGEVRTEIERRAAAVSADEVMIMTIVHDPGARTRSYELIAEAFDRPVGR
ncbi:MAG: LLM class flavin-dependent oxidoreductase [Longimicrobiales bacterium]|nr:LLM class flavin-dependent oxidoreductase [Longimicrobiales bacterium]